jgi:DNA-binding XRE family transcriptional regulator
MHKSSIILLDNNLISFLNQNQDWACPFNRTNSKHNISSIFEHNYYLLDCHKTMDQMVKNSLKKIRESLLMSKSELAREANVSPITITRIEEGKPCRLETKRKILLALGYSLSDSKKIFGE